MMAKRFVLFIYGCLIFCQSFSQGNNTPLSRPKLVVGIVVDQMRWDYLYRYYNRYGEGGFKRLINQGFSCENTYINYLPSYTAVGHTCIYTGSVPAIAGIAGNDWTDVATGERVYCTDDSTVKSVGVNASPDGKMSPRNLLVSTITDELRMASNFQSKVIGVSLKDRAAILPAGHMANAAYWMDDESGSFITSTYYMNQLPDAVKRFNKEKNIQKLIEKDWTTLYPIGTYKESDSDKKVYEGILPGETEPVFPHHLKAAYAANHASFRISPFGNTLTLQFASQMLDAYQLGQGPATDFLTINCASTDYVGHVFGPNSIEVEDTYLRLDQDLAAFFGELDQKLGKNNYLVFLTADHGAAHAVGYSQEHQMPASFFSTANIVAAVDQLIKEKFGLSNIIRSAENYQIGFNIERIDSAKADFSAIKRLVVDYFRQQPGISFAVDMEKIQEAPIPDAIKSRIVNGYNYKRSGQVQVVFQPGWLETYARKGTTHGAWNPYDTHIPLIFMGWNISAGSTSDKIFMTDISPTIAALLHIQVPNGNIGSPITAITK